MGSEAGAIPVNQPLKEDDQSKQYAILGDLIDALLPDDSAVDRLQVAAKAVDEQQKPLSRPNDTKITEIIQYLAEHTKLLGAPKNSVSVLKSEDESVIQNRLHDLAKQSDYKLVCDNGGVPKLQTVSSANESSPKDLFGSEGLGNLVQSIVNASALLDLNLTKLQKFKNVFSGKPLLYYGMDVSMKRLADFGDFPFADRSIGSDPTWFSDANFGRQLLNGPHPNSFQLVTSVHLKYKALFNENVIPGFQKLVTDKKLYVLEFNQFDFIKDDKKKLKRWLPDPVCVLQAVETDGEENIVPIAILLSKTSTVVFTKKSGLEWPWRYAKTVVHAADWFMHEVGQHLTLCHFLEEVFAVSTFACFTEDHVVLKLLAPFFRKTLYLNALARKALVPVVINSLVAGGETTANILSKRVYDEYNVQKNLWPNQLQNRGITLTEPCLKTYYYAQDCNAYWAAIRKLVKAVIESVYSSDDALSKDLAFKNWVNMLTGKDENGALKEYFMGNGKVDLGTMTPSKKRSDLIDLLTFIIFNGSVTHSAVNYSQEYYYSFGANSPPGALYKQPPQTQKEADAWSKQDLLDSLPNNAACYASGMMLSALSTTVDTTNDESLRSWAQNLIDKLKYKPTFLNSDPTVVATTLTTLQGFTTDLKAIEDAFVNRDDEYTYLQPNVVATSILI